MNSNPLVSVIIPCYNVQEFVAKAVYSILNQSYRNLEVIIVDDASTDGTLEIIKSIEDSRITILSFTENTKKIGAVNAAIKLAKGSLIAFQDADDWSEPDRVEQQVSMFTRFPDLGICFTNYKVYESRKVNESYKIALTPDELRDEFLSFRSKKHVHLAPTMCPSMMLKKQIAYETGGYHPFFAGRVAEDIHWIYRILKKYEGRSVNKALYNYSIRQGSLTQNQLAGTNPKAAYIWHLLSKIISKDVNENIDLLSPEHCDELQRVELLACEEALVEMIEVYNRHLFTYKNSSSYKLGRILLKPILLLHNISRKK